jgi:hypothetical protein
MKNYLRIAATSTVVMFGLSVASASAHQAAATQTSTDTSTTSKKHHHKAKDTSTTAAPAATTTAAPAAAATTAATKTTAAATSTTTKTKGPAFTPTPNASAADIASAKSSGMVWVNTNSKAYHASTSKYYGATKAGKFMSVADAQKAGYHAAKD